MPDLEATYQAAASKGAAPAARSLSALSDWCVARGSAALATAAATGTARGALAPGRAAQIIAGTPAP